MIYRFKSTLLGKQVLQVSKGEQEFDSPYEDKEEKIRCTIWHDADRWEAEELLKQTKEKNDGA